MELGARCAGPSSGQGVLLPCRRDGPALSQKNLSACGGSLHVRKRRVPVWGPWWRGRRSAQPRVGPRRPAGGAAVRLPALSQRVPSGWSGSRLAPQCE